MVLITLVNPGLSKTSIEICIQMQHLYIFNNKLYLWACSFWSLCKVKYYFRLINEETAIRIIRHFFSLHPLQVAEGRSCERWAQTQGAWKSLWLHRYLWQEESETTKILNPMGFHYYFPYHSTWTMGRNTILWSVSRNLSNGNIIFCFNYYFTNEVNE